MAHDCLAGVNNSEPSSRFAVVMRSAHPDYLGPGMRPEEWLLIKWPEDEAEPTKYCLTTAPSYATLEKMVFVTKMSWRIERDFQDLKQNFELSHYEGRNWRGFHRHAMLSIAVYETNERNNPCFEIAKDAADLFQRWKKGN